MVHAGLSCTGDCNHHGGGCGGYEVVIRMMEMMAILVIVIKIGTCWSVMHR